jgi:hypothetical protein
MPLSRPMRSHTTIHTQDIANAPLPPRVVTPRTLNPSPPRMPTRSQRLSPCNLSQNDFCRMETAHMDIALGNNHKRNGMHGTREGSPSITTLDTRLWQQMQTPPPRHLGHPWHRHMFLHQPHKHPEGQKYHLRQNSLQLQTSQEGKERVRLTVGGDILDYFGDVLIPQARPAHKYPNAPWEMMHPPWGR